MDYIPKDRIILESGGRELKDYLLSDQLFWPVDQGERLTLGSFLLAGLRAQAWAKTPQEIALVSKSAEQTAQIRAEWRTAWSNKALLEFHARLRQWGTALAEILSPEHRNAVVYPHEVTLRVMMALLQPELLQSDHSGVEQLLALDRKLSAASRKTGFIWDPLLTDVFPEKNYWFLYCSPAQEK